MKTKWTDIEPGMDAVFLPGKIHGDPDEVYIIYINESANEGNGSVEIEIVDARRILQLYKKVGGDADEFFDILPDWFQGEWYYCDNVPERKEYFDSYIESYYDADFVLGRDGNIDDELKFLVEWAKGVVNEDD